MIIKSINQWKNLYYTLDSLSESRIEVIGESRVEFEIEYALEQRGSELKQEKSNQGLLSYDPRSRDRE